MSKRLLELLANQMSSIPHKCDNFCSTLSSLLLVMVSFASTVSTFEFESIGFELIPNGDMFCQRNKETRKEVFVSFYGTEPQYCSLLWSCLMHSEWRWSRPVRDKELKPEHLLFTLLFFKVYDTEKVLATMVRVDPKTFRKWAWCFAEGISLLASKLVR